MINCWLSQIQLLSSNASVATLGMTISELFKVIGEEECMENLERDSCRLSSSQVLLYHNL